MKSALFAVAGVSASTYTLPTISWDKTAMDKFTSGLDTYAKQAVVDDQVDKTKWVADLVNVYAAWEVENYKTFGAAMKPVVQSEVDFLSAMTVDSTCNTTIATQCLNTWLINGADYYTQSTMETCIKTKASCTTKWDDMTLAQKQAMATKYKTSVRNMGLAYKKVHDKIMYKLSTAWSDHMQRRQAMAVKFIAAAKTAAVNMGCTSTCVDTAFSQHKGHALDYLSNNCSCGAGVITFTPGKYSNYYEQDFDTTPELTLF